MQPIILVVDDHPQYSATLCKMLRLSMPEVRILTAGDGSTALSLTEHQRFDLLIVDYHLPTISGGDVVRRLRSRANASGIPTPPVVLTSSQPDVAVFARALGVAAFLPKPIFSDAVEQTIMPLLARQVGAGS